MYLRLLEPPRIASSSFFVCANRLKTTPLSPFLPLFLFFSAHPTGTYADPSRRSDCAYLLTVLILIISLGRLSVSARTHKRATQLRYTSESLPFPPPLQVTVLMELVLTASSGESSPIVTTDLLSLSITIHSATP